jgi:hypothetical protein
MMHPMYQVLRFFPPFGESAHVKNMSVHLVFHPGKKNKPSKKYGRGSKQRQRCVAKAPIQQQAGINEKYSNGYPNVCACKSF